MRQFLSRFFKVLSELAIRMILLSEFPGGMVRQILHAIRLPLSAALYLPTVIHQPPTTPEPYFLNGTRNIETAAPSVKP